MLVSKGLELAVSPAVKDPVLGTAPGSLCSILSLIPSTLNLGQQGVLGRFSALLGLNALLLQVRRQLVIVPVLVRGDSIVLPVLLDEVCEVLAIRWGGVRHVVIRQPTLQLGLVPLVVGYKS